jgi:hypothetical protein
VVNGREVDDGTDDGVQPRQGEAQRECRMAHRAVLADKARPRR